MAPRLSVILLARGPDRLIRGAAESLAAQTLDAFEVVAVHDRRTDASALHRLGAFGLGAPHALVAAAGLSEGAARNAGVRASGGGAVVVVDGGEVLAPGYLEAACLALDQNPDAAFATTRPARALQAEGTRRGPGSRVAPGDLVAGPWAAAAATVLRREAFDEAGGFDEALVELVDWELLLRLAACPGGGLWLPGELAARPPADDVRLRQALRPERYLPSIRHVLTKHAALFEREAPRALSGRERTAKELWDRERELIARRDAARADLDALVGELNALRAELGSLGRDSSPWEDLRRTSPVSRNWGLDRGKPIDRHYIEGFVAAHASDIRGAVLEVLDDGLTRRFGGDRVERSDVLDIDADNRRATVIADLRDAHAIPDDTYDCFILTQTLHVIDDIGAAIAEARRVLKPGGVLLATLPSLSMLAPDGGPGSDYWRVTAAGARTLFEKVFAPPALEIGSRGNVLAATAFLHGLSCGEVEERELDEDDADYPVIVTVRAVKEGGREPAPRKKAARSAILLYHRIAPAAHDAHRLAVSPEAFRSQLESLARDWDIVPLQTLAAAAASGRPMDRAIALTFDDGYLDNLENALPLLQQFHAPATFFLTGERPEEGIRFWWDVLESALLGNGPWPPCLALRVEGLHRAYGCADEAERLGSHQSLYSILKASPPAVRDDVLRQLIDAAAIQPPPRQRRMDQEEMRALAACPLVEIGAHGLHHLLLSSLSRDEVHREVFEGRTVIERVCKRPVTAFAYPYGDVSSDSVEIVAAAGLTCAVTCEARGLSGQERPHLLPRLQPEAWDGAELAAWLEARVARD